MSCFIYGLHYENTNWGKFYGNYKSFNYEMLERRLREQDKSTNEMVMRVNNIFAKPNTKFKECQRLFKGTEPDGSTPCRLLVHSRDGFNWINAKNANDIYTAYRIRQTEEAKEVREYCEQLKQVREAEKEQLLANRRAKALETICCEKCGKMIGRGHMARHLKSKACTK